MTKDEFLKKYHDYQTFDENEAKNEASKINKLIDETSEVIAVDFGFLGWGLMLKSAYDSVKSFEGIGK